MYNNYDQCCSLNPNPYYDTNLYRYSTLNFEHLLRGVIGTTQDMELLNDEITINTYLSSIPSFVNQQSIMEPDYIELIDLLQDYYNLKINYVEINNIFFTDETKEVMDTMKKCMNYVKKRFMNTLKQDVIN